MKFFKALALFVVATQAVKITKKGEKGGDDEGAQADIDRVVNHIINDFDTDKSGTISLQEVYDRIEPEVKKYCKARGAEDK